MHENVDGTEKRPLNLSFFLVYFTCALLFFLPLIFPVSAVLNGTETLITTDTYKTLNFPPEINGDRIAWSTQDLSLIHISEPTRRTPISYAVFCLKKKKK